ncbi:MAG: hypothetical protein HON90_00870 [Halobacteriovoraceae bacterium]|jgi:hypothetical protein|nr:hypothetical protein [Halobacteriovoraceae bacterium]
MPKIKDIGNEQLAVYQSAYNYLVANSPNDKSAQYKAEAIKKALLDRSILGISKKTKQPFKIIIYLKSIFNKRTKG